MFAPSPFCLNIKEFKVFILGADPTNFSDHGRLVFLTTVFGIGSGDNRYFKDILLNLNRVGLSLEDIYVQNLITDYLKAETSKNKNWENIAKDYIDDRKKEFDKIDTSKKKSVLVTAEVIMFALAGYNIPDASDFYESPSKIPVLANKNKLDRPLIPFYRHTKYNLNRNEWQEYKMKIKEIIKYL